MSFEIDRGLLREQAAHLGINLDDAALEKFSLVARMLVEWNERINLTAITEPNEIVIKHFIDSLTVSSVLPKKEISLIDVGTGAGFPGVPLAIIRSDIKLTLLDSLNKRLIYLNELCGALEIKAALIHTRAEEAGQNEAFREKYDVAAARAVASLPVLCEYCLPFVKIGGRFIAMKGPEGETEAAVSANAAGLLGGKLAHIEKTRLETCAETMERRLLVFDKIEATPAKYPRITAKIKKQPL